MKYCPYCGASVMDGTVSFCAECGKSLTVAVLQEESEEKTKASSPPSNKHSSRCKKKKSRHLKTEPVRSTEEQRTQEEDSYDSYYDDIAPVDTGKLRDGVDWALLKRIGVVVAGVLLVVILCVVAMYLL